MSRQIGIRALKNSLSEVLRSLEPGEPVEVTDRGRVVARLVHVEAPLAPPTWLDQMLRAGLVPLPDADTGALQWPAVPPLPAGQAAEWLDAERGER
jgi:prevent-host-death family protein